MNRSTCFYVRIERENKGIRKLPKSEKKKEKAYVWEIGGSRRHVS